MNGHTDSVRARPAPRRARQGTVLLITGIVGLVVAVLILAGPLAALGAEVHLLGSYMVLSGLLRIHRAQAGDGMATGGRVAHGVLGVLVLVAGVAAVVHPAGELSAWVVLIAIAWVLEAGVVLTGSTFSAARSLTLVAAVLSVCIAVALISYPLVGVPAATASSAVFLVMFSAAQLFEGILTWAPARYEAAIVGPTSLPDREQR